MQKKGGITVQYREFGNTGIKVSALGFGCMRFPTIGEDKKINEPEAIRMLRDAIDAGVNYVDTAWPYHNQESEVLVGKALKDGYREKVYLATKSPVFNIKEEGDFDNFLNKQLERLQTDHIDFYLLHALDWNRWENVVLKFGLLDKMKEAKASGKIRHIGFSFHDNNEAFHKIVDGFDAWEFCQIQYNYIDVENQAGTEGLHYAASKGLGVVIMEPLLGGKLAVPPAQVAKVLRDERTPVEWALDFIWNQKECSLLLSGMSTYEQVQQNLEYAERSSIGMLSEKDDKMLDEARHIFQTMAHVPCTKCAYCMPCPFGLDIPKIYEAYNMSAALNKEKAAEAYFAMETLADACKQCKKCESICPQHIEPLKFMPEIAAFFAEVKK